jgi:hypothetical protein
MTKRPSSFNAPKEILEKIEPVPMPTGRDGTAPHRIAWPDPAKTIKVERQMRHWQDYRKPLLIVTSIPLKCPHNPDSNPEVGCGPDGHLLTALMLNHIRPAIHPIL